MAVAAAETASAHLCLVPSPAAVPAAEASAAPSAMPTAALGPAGWASWSAVKVDGAPGKTPIVEMGDRRRRSDGRKAAGDEAAVPPVGTDGREGQGGRTDKECESRWREEDERRRYCNNDGRWRQHDDRRRQRGAEPRAGRWRWWDSRYGRGSQPPSWRGRYRRRGDRRKSEDDRRRGNVDRRRLNDQRRRDDHAERRTHRQTAPCPGAGAPGPTEIAPAPGAAPIPPARTQLVKSAPAPPAPEFGRGEGPAPPGAAPSVLVPTEMPAVVVPASATVPASGFVPAATAMRAPATMSATPSFVPGLNRTGEGYRQY